MICVFNIFRFYDLFVSSNVYAANSAMAEVAWLRGPASNAEDHMAETAFVIEMLPLSSR